MEKTKKAFWAIASAGSALAAITIIATFFLPPVPPGGLEKMEAQLSQSSKKVGKDHPAPGDSVLGIAMERGCPLTNGVAANDCLAKNIQTMQNLCAHVYPEIIKGLEAARDDPAYYLRQEAHSAAQNAKVTP